MQSWLLSYIVILIVITTENETVLCSAHTAINLLARFMQIQYELRIAAQVHEL